MSATSKVFLRATVVWIVIILAETVHGIARIQILEPSVGEFRARQMAVFSGAAIIFLVTRSLIRWIGANGPFALVAIGLFWMVLTIAFELLIGRFVFGFSWQRIAAEYDITSGSLMPLGLVFLVFCPLLASISRKSSDPI
ncbi:MAG TPA: hypothetical protein PLN05_06140 [Pyrinomonadaceae bacterium]|nr:hypothetical protein [Chloracidobacterium sp.]HBE83716.1 hypothetical protein [Blastocatellia bacterium]HRJ87850.1 hypothetical protein [Pyrinomonadaceae bacterium]HRK49993.1 hypothetical protein [Pyrinomonadaceae bacterium]